MKIKVSEATNIQLNYLVAVSMGGVGFHYDTVATYWIKLDGKDRALSKGWAQSFTPTTDWAQGGPIIDSEKLCVGFNHQADPEYCPINDPTTNCWARTTSGGYLKYGPTPLIAAMRCFVVSKLGEEVDIPEALK